jgi:AbrB family looped-hinge helix DNA binding protein
MPTSTLTSKRQTTIPLEVRRHLHLHPGDKLDFVLCEDLSMNNLLINFSNHPEIFH